MTWPASSRKSPADINRQLGILITRRGEVAYVIVGSHHNIVIPSLDGFRSSSRRFKGLRLIHTHLAGEGLTTDDLTDLALLRLDLVCAVEAGEDGLPGLAHTAHLIPENPEGRYWLTLDPQRPAEMELDFTAFITALEGEFARRQKTRKVEAVDRAILVRVETNPLSDSEASLAELRELCRTSGVEVFDAVIQHRPEVDPRFLIGKGKLSDLVIRALQMGANLLIFDHELTAAQIRSIADFTEMKVIDRTQVILDIFAQRAHSREGKIQVELAQLKYRLPRLTRQDAGLSRLAGGIGGTGPGETKLEVDRRRIRDADPPPGEGAEGYREGPGTAAGAAGSGGPPRHLHRGVHQRGKIDAPERPDQERRSSPRTASSRRSTRRARASASPGTPKRSSPIRSVSSGTCRRSSSPPSRPPSTSSRRRTSSST